MATLSAMFHTHPGIFLTGAGLECILVGLLRYRVFGSCDDCAALDKTAQNEPPPGREPPPAPAASLTAEKEAPPVLLPKEPVPATPILAIRPGCRAKLLPYTAEFAQCLNDGCSGCGHQLYYGDVIFCFHPQREEIVKQTKPPV